MEYCAIIQDDGCVTMEKGGYIFIMFLETQQKIVGADDHNYVF